MRKLTTIATNNPEIKQLQANVKTVITRIVDKEVLNGVLLRDIKLTNGIVESISHKLGRTPLGYIVVRKNANSVIWDSTLDSKLISLNCSADVTVSIWVF